MELPEPLPDTFLIKQKSPTNPLGLQSRELASLFKRAFSHDPRVQQVNVESTSGSTSTSLSPSSFSRLSAPASSDETNTAPISALCKWTEEQRWTSTKESAPTGTGKCAPSRSLGNCRNYQPKLVERKRCNSAPSDNRLKAPAMKKESGNLASSSMSEKEGTKEDEEGKDGLDVGNLLNVEPQICKPTKTREASSVTRPSPAEKTDIGYLFIYKEDKLVRIPIKLDVDRKEERSIQNVSAGSDTRKYPNSSKDKRIVSMRKQVMEDLDMDLKKLFENCDWAKVTDSEGGDEVAFNSDLKTQEGPENPGMIQAPVSDAATQPSQNSTTLPQRDEALNYSKGFLEAETCVSSAIPPSLKRSYMRSNSALDPIDAPMDQFRLGQSSLRRNPFQTFKRYKTVAASKSMTPPPPAHHAARGATPGGIVFRPAKLTVPGVPPPRISDCWAFNLANPTFQMEKPLDCSRENQNILLGSQKTFGVAWSSIGPAAAAATATPVKPVDQQPKQTSESKSEPLCLSATSVESDFTAYLSQPLQSFPTKTATDAAAGRTTALAGDRNFSAFTACTGQSFSSLARHVRLEDVKAQHSADLVPNKNASIHPPSSTVKFAVPLKRRQCPVTRPRAGNNPPPGMSHPLPPCETVSHTDFALESMRVPQGQATMAPSASSEAVPTPASLTHPPLPISIKIAAANTQPVVVGENTNNSSSFTRYSASSSMTTSLPPGVFVHHDGLRPEACAQSRQGEHAVLHVMPPAVMHVKYCAKCCFPAPNVNALDLQQQEMPMDLSRQSTTAGSALLPNNKQNGSHLELSSGSNFMPSSLKENVINNPQRENGDAMCLSTHPRPGENGVHECARCHREPKNCICPPPPSAYLPTSGVPHSCALNSAPHCHVYQVCPDAPPNPDQVPPSANGPAKRASRRPQDPRPFACNYCSMSYGTRGHLQKHYHSRQHLTKLCVNLRYDEAAMDIKSLPPNFLRSLTVDENTGMLSKTEVDKIAKFKEEQNTKKSPTAPESHMSC